MATEHEPRHSGWFGGGHGEWATFVTVSTVLVVAAVAVAWYFAEPAPPKRVVIASGAADGYYYRVASRYAAQFADSGIELLVRQTAGSVENLALLADRASGVDAAIVQGGVAPLDQKGLEAIATIGLEPVWVFYRGDDTWTRLTDLMGRRVAVGAAGSGVKALAVRLLADNGVEAGAGGTQLVELGGAAAVTALRDGAVDAAFFVTAPTTPMIAELLSLPGVRLMSFEQADAYGRRYTFLSPLTLYEGVVDLKRNLPAIDVHMVAPATVLVVRDDTHPAVIQLLVYAAQAVHREGDALSEPGTFPSMQRTGLPVSDEARYHFTHGPGFLQRHLPFWLSSLIDRLLILAIPLIVVLMPLLRFMPPVYRWQIRSRIYRWYKRLRGIDARLRDEPTPDQARTDRQAIAQLEREIMHVRVPLGYMQEFYNLRLHVGYLRDRLDAYIREKTQQ